jgi:hypothetical protein
MNATRERKILTQSKYERFNTKIGDGCAIHDVKTVVAVARKPNTKANFGRATRLPHRRLMMLCAARIILTMKKPIRIPSQTRVCRMLWGEELPDSPNSKRHILRSKITSNFGTSR